MSVAGVRMDIWNAAFLVGIVIGYGVLLASLRGQPRSTRPSALPLRYALVVYACALGAQLLSYVVDANTSVLPPGGTPALRYYLDPLYGPKTLYGAVLALPVAVALAIPSSHGLGILLDQWTPALMSVLATARVGCFLQGCCYGVRSDRFGVLFPPGSAAHAAQRLGTEPGYPVLPTQLLEAVALAGLAFWALRAFRLRRPAVFLTTVTIYSAMRFVLEFVRGDPERGLVGPLTPSQWIALLVIGLYASWRSLPSRSPRPAASLR